MDIHDAPYRSLNEAPYQIPDELELVEVGPEMALRWEYLSEEEKAGDPAQRDDDRHLLPRFAGLADRPEKDQPGAVLRFAKHFGVLELCQHGLVYTDPRGHMGRPVPSCEPTKQEPIRTWVDLSRKAGALLRLVSAHKVGRGAWRAGELERDLKILSGALYGDRRGSPGTTGRFLREARTLLGDPGQLGRLISLNLSDWARRYRVLLQTRADPLTGRIHLLTDGTGVMGAVTRQLMAFAAGGDLLLPCAGCGTWVTPKRKPRLRKGSLERTWCIDCGRAAARMHQRERRARIDPSR